MENNIRNTGKIKLKIDIGPRGCLDLKVLNQEIASKKIDIKVRIKATQTQIIIHDSTNIECFQGAFSMDWNTA